MHQAIGILTEINNDPEHLFAHHGTLMGHPGARINEFRDHLNTLFGTLGEPFIPHDGEQPWAFTTRQFRRTLAWHLAHQPFGVVAGARQYKHAKITMFEGYAGTTDSGFAAEVAAEQTIAQLDYVEDLYRDWNDGASAGGGAAARINAEFDRIRVELGDLPGTVAEPARLRAMLRHLGTTLHPGVLNDCFFTPATAICLKRATTPGPPVPQHTACLRCSNARRSTVHLGRLTAARDQAHQLDQECRRRAEQIPPLQRQAIRTHLAELDTLIAELEPKRTS
ncbi:hypothetical protein [Actinoplanes sp. NPDC051411]|uniref:hypothetical protein n=1 Tax=Actinoplanes sp. NPDC051411 TaxID=3155522 RepID=UPI00343B10AD